MELHKKLARLRQEKGWSQEKTAAELGGVPSGCAEMGKRRGRAGAG